MNVLDVTQANEHDHCDLDQNRHKIPFNYSAVCTLLLPEPLIYRAFDIK